MVSGYGPSARNYGPSIGRTEVARPYSKRVQALGQPSNAAGPARPPVVLKQQYEWQKWDEITLKFRGLREGETTHSLWSSFRRHGNVSFLEIFLSKSGNGIRDGGGKVKFSPPPQEAFWTRGPYMLVSESGESRYTINVFMPGNITGTKIQSPIKKMVWYPPKMRLVGSALHFGLMISPESMMPLREVLPQQPGDLKLVIDLIHKRVVAEFDVPFEDPRQQGDTSFTSSAKIGEYNRLNKYMFQVDFSHLKTIFRMNLKKEHFGLAISLDSPPQFYRKRQDDRAGHSDENNMWTEFDTWYRQTDVVYDPFRLQRAKIALHKERPVIDIGRWTTYLFEFSKTANSPETYDQMKQALQDFNIEIVDIEAFKKAEADTPILWPLIDTPTSNQAFTSLEYLTGTTQHISLPFEVRYQLEVCISREILNEYNITTNFVRKLAAIATANPTKARNILEYVAGQDKRIFDPTSIFEDKEALSFSAKTEVPYYCAYSRKATITPSTIYFSSPTVETTNRVLRYYARENTEGRFLRVQFTDELAEGAINACADKQRNDELFTRVYRTLFNGIQIGDRHFEFLAFGNSQFRENGAYFFCPTEHLSCNDIRMWMGDFGHIKIVAKYAARLGQCFSTTRAINGLSKPDIIKIPDIELEVDRAKYCFTDGVGKISVFLAQMIAAELKINSKFPPSAFQFRLGGCKGILVVWPDAKDKEVHIRRSQQKFTAVYNGLEIIRCSHFSCATLNRQTITILSALGVPDEVFLRMLTEQLANYQSAMSNDDMAISLLLRYIDDNQMTINIATMIRNGFMAHRDPFVLSLLHLWRSWSIKLLKEKAKIIVENGAFVLGCIDETRTLRGYTKPKSERGQQVAEDELPQIFLQVPDKEEPSRYNVIEGICLVGRNPSLHPGDLRVVQAVNIPALHHLRDVVVFPATGERDIPSMCSGGDLDGDDYFVIWDKALQPPEWNADPMNYTAPKPAELSRPVQITDMMKFFVRYMKNDSLPTIAHAHLANSDFLENGVKDPKCLELAALHSKAVDYVKTGEPAQMPKHLRPQKWPHFMEKKHKPKDAQYVSKKILGQLYDRVESVNFIPQYAEPFDKRILRAYTLTDELLKGVRQIKSKYDTAMRRIMAQQDIKTEFEIWSTFVLSRPRVGSDYKVQEEIARLSDALKDQFRATCIEKAGSKEFSVLGPFVAGMYKVTKEEMDIALAECRATKMVGGREVPVRKMEPGYMPLITFPWLFEKELGRIATGIDGTEDLEDFLSPLNLNPGRKRAGAGVRQPSDDHIQLEDGVIVHRGETLDLFRQDVDSDGFAEDSDLEDGEEHRFMKGKDGEDVLATGFEFTGTLIPDYLKQGTGVEDVVPQYAMDGLVGRPASTPSSSGPLTPASGDVEEEIVHLDIQETSVDKLARLTDVKPVPSTTSSSGPSASISNSGIPMEKVAATDIKMLASGMITRRNVSSESPIAHDEAEEDEVVTLDIPESSMNKLARLNGIDMEPSNTHSGDPVPSGIAIDDDDDDDEVITLDIPESSSIDKLARLYVDSA